MLKVVNVDKDSVPVAATFDDFWTMYPRRLAKKDARRAWDRLSAAQHIYALTALVDWRRVWAKKDIDYVPHPATWLNGERWEDELPKQVTATAAAHASAKLPEVGPRTEMPQKVRDELARLRR